MHDLPELTSCQQFHPSAELLSYLMQGLVSNLGPGVHQPATLGHLTQDKKNYLTDFIPIVKLDNNPLLLDISQEDKNLIMAAYVTFLLTGHTLLCMAIKVDTAKLYLKAVTKLFLDNNQWDPAIVRTGDSAPVFNALFHGAKRWESMPSRQEPVTIEMTEHLITQATQCSPDNFESALADWVIMGNQSGFRSSKWCQPYSNKSLPVNRSITRNIDSSASAFIASNFSLRDKHKRPLTISATLDPTTFVYCDTCWRFQKNNNNGEIITYDHNDLKPTHYYIRAVLRILARADRLVLILTHSQ